MSQAALLVGLAACDAPARSKPWRHAPEPVVKTAVRLRAEPVRREDVLRIRLEAEPQHLNPLVDPDVAAIEVAADTIFEPLIRVRFSEAGMPGGYEAALATYRITADGREIRLQLRDGVNFHDGKPFTAVDAQFSLDAARSPSVRATHVRGLLADVVSVDLWGPLEIRIPLRKPSGTVLRALAEIPMLPAHVYRDGDLNAHAKNRSPVGTGPYRLLRWDRGREIVLARNESYWGDAPNIDEVDFIVDPDAARSLIRAKRGEIDVIPTLIPEHYPEQTTIAGVAENFSPLRLAPPRFRYLVVNTLRPPFSDVQVRRAAALLLPRQGISEDVHKGLSRPFGTPIWPAGPIDGPALDPPPCDPSAAAALLEEAEWIDRDGDGVREHGTDKLRIALLSIADARSDQERERIVGAFRGAGFLVEVRPGEPAFLLNRLRAGDFDAAVLEWRGRSDDDLSPLVATGGALNYGGFSSPAVDVACAAIAGSYDITAKRSHAAELGRLLAAEWPIIGITSPEPVGLIHKRVVGVKVWNGWFAIRDLELRPSP